MWKIHNLQKRKLMYLLSINLYMQYTCFNHFDKSLKEENIYKFEVVTICLITPLIRICRSLWIEQLTKKCFNKVSWQWCPDMAQRSAKSLPLEMLCTEEKTKTGGISNKQFWGWHSCEVSVLKHIQILIFKISLHCKQQ